MRILIADDDRHLRDGVADLLKLEGYECVVAEDGKGALSLYYAENPDICILDVVMPGLDGIEVCRAIRDDNADIPILLLSARDQELDRVRGLETGADDYVAKPFGARELIARIKAITRRSSLGVVNNIAQQRFLMGDLEIDRRALRAFRDDDTIDLTRRELKFLSVLHERAGLAVSRDELLNLCWGRTYLPSSRALDQFVSALRRKIEHDSRKPRIIRTVHSVGYRYDG